MNTITFTKNNGSWFILVPKDLWVEGALATVTMKNGTTKNVEMGDWFEDMGDHYLVEFIDHTPKPARAKTVKKAPAKKPAPIKVNRAGNLATDKQLAFLRRLIRDNTQGSVLSIDSNITDIPTESELLSMTKREASDLINLLTNS